MFIWKDRSISVVFFVHNYFRDNKAATKEQHLLIPSQTEWPLSSITGQQIVPHYNTSVFNLSFTILLSDALITTHLF